MLKFMDCLLWAVRLMLVVSLISVPVSASHASTKFANCSSNLVSTGEQFTDIKIRHSSGLLSVAYDGFDMAADERSQHEQENCCSYFCGGVMITDDQLLSCTQLPVLKILFKAPPLAPGEWATPHRPPSI